MAVSILAASSYIRFTLYVLFCHNPSHIIFIWWRRGVGSLNTSINSYLTNTQVWQIYSLDRPNLKNAYLCYKK